MNGFDFALIAIVALSTLFAFARGIVRELIALATWVAALIAAFGYAGTVANWFSGLDMSAAAKHVLAFALILIAVLIAGALVARMLSGVVKAIGLGFVDRLLGAVFGVARGIAHRRALCPARGADRRCPSRIGGRMRCSDGRWRRPHWR